MKYPIGIQNFESLRRDGYYYVDKTALVYQLANEGSFYFLSRPRRFGKSLLISTLEAYFSGRRDLFKGLAVERMEKDWTAYPILHLDLNTDRYNAREVLEQRLNLFLSKWEERYERNPNEATLSQRFEGIIQRVSEKTGSRVVILVDEYDKPLLQAFGNELLQDEFRNILKAFYGALKSQDRYIRFAFLTGVTKFGKKSVFSDLNNLTDISMDARYQTICGITKEEIGKYFQEGLRGLAANYHLTLSEVLERLRKRYDGYHFRQHGIGIYNPFSLLNTFATSEFGSYWFETGTPTFLVELLKRDQFYLPALTEGEVTADALNSLDPMDKSPVPIIYQSGYLTIKDYDEEFQTYRLSFPNEEVEEGFIRFLLPCYTHTTAKDGPMFIGHFVRDLRQGRPDDFMRRMETLFADTDYKIVGDAELYFQNAFYVVTKMLGFYVEVERTLSDGRMDMVVQTKDYVYIFEFKYDQTADTALRQIDDKGYARPFAADRRKLYKIGVNFSRQKRCIDGWKVVS